MSDPNQKLPEIDKTLCIKCGACVSVCNTGAMKGKEVVPMIAAPELCTRCAECEDTCPVGAINIPFSIHWA